MQINLSLILNILLLVAVVVAISGLLRARRQASMSYVQDNDDAHPAPSHSMDDVIAVRRIQPATPDVEVEQVETISPRNSQVKTQVIDKSAKKTETIVPKQQEPMVLFLSAKPDQSFAGYDLLQSLLAAGLRFGEGGVFHRHQFDNGQGPVVCSLAAATSNGTFDMQNMGAISVRGLCLYMQPCNNPGIDSDRFELMMQVANQLCDDLNAQLLDDQRKPWSEASVTRYRHRLMVEEVI